jgi:hypothetical protein
MSDVHRHQEKRGYRKIQLCCQRALKDAYSYIWVDTVCIDKTSNVELSEAINSMYKWYSKAEVCYAFLEDLETVQTSDSFLSDLRDCRWFTRGWTLQELIAPRQVIFVNKDWVEVGDKGSLTEIIRDYWNRPLDSEWATAYSTTQCRQPYVLGFTEENNSSRGRSILPPRDIWNQHALALW